MPDTHNYPQIDGLLGSSQPINCQGADGTTRIALQITLRQPRQHRQTLGFFRGAHIRWESCGDSAVWCLVWVTPPPGDKVAPRLWSDPVSGWQLIGLVSLADRSTNSTTASER